MRAVVCGANGAMGKLICGIFGDEVVGKVSIDGENNVPKTFEELGAVEADVVVDFSHHTAIASVLAYAEKIGAAAVIGTTGHTAEEKELIFAAAKQIPVFYAGNVSLGIAVLCRLVKQAASYFPDADIEIVDKFFDGDVAGAAQMQKYLYPLIKMLFCEVNPIPVKAACAAMGFCENRLRLPLTQMEPQNELLLLREMRKLGILR